MKMPSATYLGKALIVLSLSATAQQALADSENAHLGRVMWTAFECGTYAEMSGDMERMQALYNHGIEAGRTYIRAIRANEITPQELKAHAPIGVTMRLGGDSDDIMIGRILEAAIGDAFDNIVKQDSNGMPLEMGDWINDDGLRAAKAETKYQTSNCDLIR